jgi:hypothetical protein
LAPQIIVAWLPLNLPKPPKFSGRSGEDLEKHIEAFSLAYIKFINDNNIAVNIFPQTLARDALHLLN